MSFDIFDQIRSFLKGSKACIDNNIFALHYRASFIILLSFSLIIGTRKYFGDPIDCTAQRDDIERIVDNFCWFNSYIIVPRDPNEPYKYSDDAHRYRPVINSAIQKFEQLEDPKSKYKAYFLHAYQWIEFILFIQAVLFFFPRYLWRHCWEQGRVHALTEGFSLISLKHEQENEAKKKFYDMVQFIKRNKNSHLLYACKYFFCEILNFVNVSAQFYVVHSTLKLSWAELIDDFISSTSHVKPESPINLVFPNLARCEIPTANGAGHVYSLEMCVLPVNVFVTKMYIFLWFYLQGLSILSGFSLLYRIATIMSPRLRYFLMNLQRSSWPSSSLDKNSEGSLRRLNYGEWFLLSLLSKNMDTFSFDNLLKEYNSQMSEYRLYPLLPSIGENKKDTREIKV